MKIRYRKSKYTLEDDYWCQTPILGYHIVEKWFVLTPDGMLHIFAGFGWDGASGPTIDTKSSMGPSAVHDVFCYLMREGKIDYNKWQDTINEFFRNHCIEKNMPEWRADIWHWGVEFGDAGNPSQGPDPARKIYEAP